MFLSDARIINPYELEELSPELYALYEIGAYDEDEDEDGGEILYFDRDVQLSAFEYQELKDRFGHYILWAVNGNLMLENSSFSRPAIIKGDLVCKSLMYNEYLKAAGKITVKNYAAFIAEDHEMLKVTDPLTLEARYVFSWFYDLKNINLPENTPVFMVCNGTDFRNMNLADPYFYWKEWAFVMRPELCYAIDSNYSDALYWNFTALEEALEKKRGYLLKDLILQVCLFTVRHLFSYIKRNTGNPISWLSRRQHSLRIFITRNFIWDTACIVHPHLNRLFRFLKKL